MKQKPTYPPASNDLETTRPEREANALSILDIPRAELPDLDARAELVWRALYGEDVYAYIPAGDETHVLWMRQPDPAAEARIAPMAWARRWREAGMPTVCVEREGGAA